MRSLHPGFAFPAKWFKQLEEVQMTNRFWISSGVLTVVIASILLAPAFLAAQAPSATHAAAKAKTWTVLRTPDGQPDLQGYWTSLSFTPMERPAKYAGREFLTDEEMAQVFKAGVQHAYEFTYANSAETPVYDSTVYALGAWQNGVTPNRRTSLVVDPPDGKIPLLTPEAQNARAAMKKIPTANENLELEGPVRADGPEDLTLGVRCLSFGGPPILPAAYNSDVHIVQGAGYVMIEYEWNSEVRIIPLDGRPRLSRNMHRWHGDSRGHWEGNTLVVETTNFRPGATFQNANPKTLKITERFTRLDAATIEYKFTIDDPATWTKPWSAIVPLSHIEGPMFEYACGEGNNGIVNILAGARATEKAAARGPQKNSN
jgi:hypothetical protein